MKKLVLTGILTLSFILTACGNTTESDNLQANVERDVSISIEQEVKDVNMATEATPVSEISSIIEETKEIESSKVIETEVIETTEVSTTIEETEVAATPEPTSSEFEYDEYCFGSDGQQFTWDADDPNAPWNKLSNSNTTNNVEYALPYIVNGIDIRSGDNDGDGISDNHQNTWYNGVTWTSSSGIVLRVADGFELNPGHMNVYSVFVDGTEDLRPNSDFMKACHEFWGDAYAKELDLSDLPNIIPVSAKQTTINENYPSFAAYRVVFDSLWQKQNGSSGAMLQPYSKNGDGTCNGIGLLDTLAGASYMWNLDYDSTNGYWILALKSNYTELQWNSILNSLRMITPDANQVYTEIYNGFYSDNSVLVQNYQSWVQIGNTNVMATGNGNGSTYIMIK